MLLAAKMLEPGKSTMTIEYLGQKFVGDLLADGKIKSQETETIFCSPSAWAMHCKRIINPEKKSGCGWASVKYKGKKLDAYKAQWLRRCAAQKEETTLSDGERRWWPLLPAHLPNSDCVCVLFRGERSPDQGAEPGADRRAPGDAAESHIQSQHHPVSAQSRVPSAPTRAKLIASLFMQ